MKILRNSEKKSMDFVVIPQLLLMFYGGVVLACGSVLGFVAGRNAKKRLQAPEPPDLLERRVKVLEVELEVAQSELADLREGSEFLRRLHSPQVPDPKPREKGRSVA